LGDVLAAGSTVNLGDGADTLLGTSLPATSLSATSVIEGGDGVDSVSSGLINAGNAALFKNFENLSIQASVDASLLTGSTITGLTIDASTGTSTISGLTQSQGLTVKANNAGTSSTLTFTGVSGTADSYAIGFNATTTGTTASPTSIDAKMVSIEGIETVTVNSAAAAGVVTNAIALKGAAAKTLTITGNQALNVTFDTAFGTTQSGTTVTGVTAIGEIELGIGEIDIWRIVKEFIPHGNIIRKHSMNGIVINCYGNRE
jgi:S-layer protein